MKVRSLQELEAALDGDLAWRRKELSALTFSIAEMDGDDVASMLCRAGVALTYSHWEGYVRNGASSYLTYLDSLRLPLRDLLPCLIAAAKSADISRLGVSRRAEARTQLVQVILKPDAVATFDADRLVGRRSSLDSEEMADLLALLGVGFPQFDTKRRLVDTSLVARRHSIAHGEFRSVETSDVVGLIAVVSELLSLYRDLLNDAAKNRMFLAAA